MAGWVSEATGVIRERDLPGLDRSEVDTDNLCSGELVGNVDGPVHNWNEHLLGRVGVYAMTCHVPEPVPRSRTRKKEDETAVPTLQNDEGTSLGVVGQTGGPLLRGQHSFCL